MKTGNFNWRINNQIRAPKVLVLGKDKSKMGEMSLSNALSEAQKAGLDLVEIAPNANPPVVRIVEIGKFRYEQEKKLRKQKKSTKTSETKEIRFSPFIAEHDFLNRIDKIKDFLAQKNKVRVVVKFGGRQMDSKDFGYKLVERIIRSFGETISIDMEPKFIGRHLTTVISPTNKVKRER